MHTRGARFVHLASKMCTLEEQDVQSRGALCVHEGSKIGTLGEHIFLDG